MSYACEMKLISQILCPECSFNLGSSPTEFNEPLDGTFFGALISFVPYSVVSTVSVSFTLTSTVTYSKMLLGFGLKMLIQTYRHKKNLRGKTQLN